MMPRRPAVIFPKIPLFMIDSVVKREVIRAGEELVRVVIRLAKGHYYEISVRTRKVCRMLLPERPKDETPNIFEVTP